MFPPGSRKSFITRTQRAGAIAHACILSHCQSQFYLGKYKFSFIGYKVNFLIGLYSQEESDNSYLLSYKVENYFFLYFELFCEY